MAVQSADNDSGQNIGKEQSLSVHWHNWEETGTSWFLGDHTQNQEELMLRPIAQVGAGDVQLKSEAYDLIQVDEIQCYSSMQVHTWVG